MVHLHIDQSIQPVELRLFGVAFHLRPKFEEESCKLEMADIMKR